MVAVTSVTYNRLEFALEAACKSGHISFSEYNVLTACCELIKENNALHGRLLDMYGASAVADLNKLFERYNP